ncbi:FAD-dependent oxidoreductase [Mycobacterium sp. 1164985.4]|uniref:flavin-containing monooxygenase n=1 Tax=Mycobacterium sp. 1164985.4 TaxID=1834069 RepID=UPI000800DF75|nr:FAD-dependent oxidoreductase [Mycobacterium sp. 1164985.4]OBK81200.1 dimethylaniline monooxygenase [Mycobacterium sp. 1164985.4]
MSGDVAVIGAGPGGLVVARWLTAQGLEPTIYERGTQSGGQWTGEPGHSGVWPDMHTNTSRILTAFSDLDPGEGAVFPPGREILAYLHRYAEMFDLTRRIRFLTPVTSVRRGNGCWLVRAAGAEQRYERVVVATGRFQSPAIPSVDGLSTFTGSAGARPTFHYRGPADYCGKRVLVAGCAVSALEIASELAQHGVEVMVTQRRQRYVLPKFAAGVPSDHRIFTRYGALADEILPVAEIDRQLREIVVDAGGTPQQYGAPAPDPLLFAAGITLSQHYLPLVAEGRIEVRPWMSSVDGTNVTFADGHAEQFDGILFGTGFKLSMPFLDNEIRSALDVDAVHFDTDRHTFHPDLPGLAFVGMWDQSGGYFVPLELQARWIAYTWGGTIRAPSGDDQRHAIEAYRSRRGLPQKTRMNLVALTFARAAGVEPAVANWPEFTRALLFGPLAPSCFRLEGPDALPDAPARFADDTAAFGAITSPAFTERENAYLALLGADSGRIA